MIRQRTTKTFSCFIVLIILLSWLQYTPVDSQAPSFQNPNLTNLFPQPIGDKGFAAKGNGVMHSNAYQLYKYNYAQNLAWVWFGFDLQVDPNETYTWSFDAYISPDANLASTGGTLVVRGEEGFPINFNYDNAYKGTWQHFEYTGQPSSTIARLLLYPAMGSSPATTGHVLYRNVDFRKTGTATNLYPQAVDDSGFTIKGSGGLEAEPYADSLWKYDYTQQLTGTWHGFDLKVDPQAVYTWSFDAYISPDADVSPTGQALIAQGESGFAKTFFYDNANKGTWQRFEHTGTPSGAVARLLLYPSMGELQATKGHLLFRNVEFKKVGSVYNLYPQPTTNEGFQVRGSGAFTSKLSRTYSYDYNQNLSGTWHGFDIAIDPTQMYTWSFEAYISENTDIPATGHKLVAQGEKGFPVTFSYDNTRKGTWQRFEHTARPTSNELRLLLYPNAYLGEAPVHQGFVLYRNVELKQWVFPSNLYPQPQENSGFGVKGNGVMHSNAYQMYKYNYAQNLTGVWFGYDLQVDPNETYTWSFDAYISPDANLTPTGGTLVVRGEEGFPVNFNYDNAYKGTWQHFEYTGQPSSTIARLLLYPAMGSSPATTGHVLYRNVDFRKTGTATNLYPQAVDDSGFTIRGSGGLEAEPYADGLWKYDYAQKLFDTWHGFDLKVDPQAVYTWSFDAYISPDADLSPTGQTLVAQGESGFAKTFFYDNANKGTWQRFEHTGTPSGAVARLLLYPTNRELPATKGHLLFRNVEFKKVGSVYNLYPQPTANEGFQVGGRGAFTSKLSRTYSYDYNQNLSGTWHGFDIAVDPTQMYTWSFDAYISENTDIPATGYKLVAQGEKGFPITFSYDNTRKGTWQRFEHTAMPTSSELRLLLYPNAYLGEAPVHQGFVLYRNVELKLAGLEWNNYVDVGGGLQYNYSTAGRLVETERVNSGGPLVQYEYDANGNILRRKLISP